MAIRLPALTETSRSRIQCFPLIANSCHTPLCAGHSDGAAVLLGGRLPASAWVCGMSRVASRWAAPWLAKIGSGGGRRLPSVSSMPFLEIRSSLCV